MAPGVKVREGYELWRPNREKASSKTTKAVIAFVLLVSAALLVIITIGGWERLQSPGVGIATIVWAILYVLFALLVIAWVRGVLPVAAAMAVIMLIFAAVAAPGWFARAKPGLDSPLLPEDLLGLLTVVVIPVQVLLIVVAMVGFNQQWSVEEERPIEGDGDGSATADTEDSDSEEEARRAESDQGAEDRTDEGTSGGSAAQPAYAVEDDTGEWDEGGQQVSPAV